MHKRSLYKIIALPLLYNHYITCEIAIALASIHDVKSSVSMLGNTYEIVKHNFGSNMRILMRKLGNEASDAINGLMFTWTHSTK